MSLSYVQSPSTLQKKIGKGPLPDFLLEGRWRQYTGFMPQLPDHTAPLLFPYRVTFDESVTKKNCAGAHTQEQNETFLTMAEIQVPNFLSQAQSKIRSQNVD